MLAISQRGLWERWIGFFLTGIMEACTDAVARAQELQALQKTYHEKIQRARSSALLGRLVDLLFEHPAISVPSAAARLGISYNAAKNNISHLVQSGILRPGPDDQRPMVFVASDVVKTIS
jgi:Fic family protein